mmetsp:Transcript_6657/g.22221  ORF Transcript_6657/g.22221 Transcript_6657/m.22221 type:complete len:237 (-) Transcript_6657:119-829(-)
MRAEYPLLHTLRSSSPIRSRLWATLGAGDDTCGRVRSPVASTPFGELVLLTLVVELVAISARVGDGFHLVEREADQRPRALHRARGYDQLAVHLLFARHAVVRLLRDEYELHVRLARRHLGDHRKLPRVVLAVLAVAEDRHARRRLGDHTKDARVLDSLLPGVVYLSADPHALLGNARAAGPRAQRPARPALRQLWRAVALFVGLDTQADVHVVGPNGKGRLDGRPRDGCGERRGD